MADLIHQEELLLHIHLEDDRHPGILPNRHSTFRCSDQNCKSFHPIQGQCNCYFSRKACQSIPHGGKMALLRLLLNMLRQLSFNYMSYITYNRNDASTPQKLFLGFVVSQFWYQVLIFPRDEQMSIPSK